MFDASDALRAHIHCRAMMILNLKQPPACIDYVDFRPQPDCPMMRFIETCAAHHTDWPEIQTLRSVHKGFHNLATDLARRRIAGEAVDIDAENAPDGAIDTASSALRAAVWRVERRLHSLAG